MLKKIIFIIWFVFSFSCKAKQEIDVYKEGIRDIGYFRQDSMVLRQFVKQLENKRAYIHHLRLMPPDSMERQYIESVTSVRLEEDLSEETTSELNTKADTQVTVTEKTQDIYKESPQKSGIKKWVWLVFVLLLIGIGIYWGKNKFPL